MTWPQDIALTTLQRVYMCTHHSEPSALAQSFISALHSSHMLHRPRTYLANTDMSSLPLW